MSNDIRYGTNKEQDNKPDSPKPVEKRDGSAAKPLVTPSSDDLKKEKDTPDAP